MLNLDRFDRTANNITEKDHLSVSRPLCTLPANSTKNQMVSPNLSCSAIGRVTISNREHLYPLQSNTHRFINLLVFLFEKPSATSVLNTTTTTTEALMQVIRNLQFLIQRQYDECASPCDTFLYSCSGSDILPVQIPANTWRHIQVNNSHGHTSINSLHQTEREQQANMCHYNHSPTDLKGIQCKRNVEFESSMSPHMPLQR